MKKIYIICVVFLLTSCNFSKEKLTPNEIILSIKNYSCNIDITYFSNKNSNTYKAKQTYNSDGKYFMEFLDNTNLKITYQNSNLIISSALFKEVFEIKNYKELNLNPLFLSYFLNTYFNLESKNNVKISNDSIELLLPPNNKYYKTAILTLKNNLPYKLSYLDEHRKEKVNIIYNEFNLIS